MTEFTGDNEKDISVGEPIVFENKTECKFEVCAGIVFHKSGVYEVSIVGNRTIVSEVPKRKIGKWIMVDKDGSWRVDKCSSCGKWWHSVRWLEPPNYCPNCGAKMEVEQDEPTR